MVGDLALVGLTGGIGSGKSTVAGLLAAHGFPVLDADRIAHEIILPGEPAHAEISRQWPQVVDAEGLIDRTRLAPLVFADATARRRLQEITHPRIQERALERIKALAEDGHRIAIYEASLLVETGRHKDFDALIVVTAPTELQIERAVARGTLNAAEVAARLAAQLPLEEKVKVATDIVDNGGSLEATTAQIETLAHRLRARFK
jgi:dephospho-CoA kinase